MIFLFGLAILCAIELTAKLTERRTCETTRVATITGTDHQIDKMGQMARLGAFGLCFVFLLTAYFASEPKLIVPAVVVIFALSRGALTLLDQAAAKASCSARLKRASQNPTISQAKLAMFFSAVDLQTPDHVTAWEAEIDAIGVPWLILTPEPHHFKALRAAGRNNVLCLPNLTTALQHLPDGLRAMLYANNAQKNRAVLRSLPGMKHVQILHGDSDKPPSYSPLTKNYDQVFVAGQMAIDRYVHNDVYIPKERFRIVGRPQVAAIAPRRADPVKRPQIVYMPTWRGFFEDTQFSSLDRADQIIETVLSLSQSADLLFKPHPLSYKDPQWPAFEKRISAVLSATHTTGANGQFSPKDLTPFDLYNRADLLICDISSVMIDFLYADKPFTTILPQGFKVEHRANFPSLAASYEVKADLSDLEPQLEAALGTDPIAAARRQVRASAFGDLDQPPGAAFQAACRALIEGTDDP